MKTIKNFWIVSLILIVTIILFNSGCKTVNEPVFGGTVTDYDGNVYHTVKIGTQTWMIENLKTTHYNDSTAIPLVTDSSKWINLKTPGYCWYNNDSVKYKDSFGALYNWYAVNTGKLAPKGWHIPTDNDWLTLENNVIQYYNLSGSLAKILASSTYWIKSNVSGSIGNNLSTNNSSGFTAMPGGCRVNEPISFNKIDSVGVWWSSTVESDTTALSLSLTNNLSTLDRINYLKLNGFSVHCVKNSN
ncbi:MAG: fibrobacter succinogenes major paralogous domain-containing protein [Paludibacter sp.]|nr:fibrobacter succinogenes major paralogous domain-containing protein [Paludibacter sp.]